LRVREHVWNLRTVRCFSIIHDALETGRGKFGLEIVHFSVQGNHIHLIVEAADSEALARGMQGLCIRIARGLNRLMGRHGRVFADRYHAQPLCTPTETRNAVSYVLSNHAIHAARPGEKVNRDEYTSASLDERWGPSVTASPRTWLLRTGCRSHR